MQDREQRVNHTVNGLIDFVYGHEGDDDAVGAVSRFVGAHCADRPAANKTSRWASIEIMKSAAGHHGPPVSAQQIDAALEAAGLN